MPNNFIFPDWPAPKYIKAASTTRSLGNLALHLENNHSMTRNNQLQLIKKLQLPSSPVWLNQLHGIHTVSIDEYKLSTSPHADAAYCRSANQVCAVLTADCLPILVTDRTGHEIAAIHAGWRGLSAGIIDNTLSFFKASPADLYIWLGPAIGPQIFEVGKEVREIFLFRHPDYKAAFKPRKNRWLANIYHLAQINLNHLGVDHIYGGQFCTYRDHLLFYSYRREKENAGRMATLIWIDSPK